MERRTKRRYAHELYPGPGECETRPLAVEVPHLYARAIGLSVDGTGWFYADLVPRMDRMHQMIDARRIATMADAMAQGLTGQAAWDWVIDHSDPEGEWFYELASKHVPNWNQIKPYLCGPTRTAHEHLSKVDARGCYTVSRVPGLEDDCDDCTEPVEETNANAD